MKFDPVDLCDPVDLAISPGQLKVSLEDFYSQVNKAAVGETEDTDAAKYYKATLQATNDKSSRVRRGEAL